MSRTIRRAFVLLVLTLLASGAVQAMPLGAQLQSAAPGGLFGAAWDWIVDLFLDGERQEPAAAWDKAGCEMDPDGLPLIIGSPGTQSNTSLTDVDLNGWQ